MQDEEPTRSVRSGGRSIFSKHLIGRRDEGHRLLQAYTRCKATLAAVGAAAAHSRDSGDDSGATPASQLPTPQELVLIQGASGTGKTFLAQSLQSKVLQDTGFFLSGKFELNRTQNPYAVFVSAFTQFTKMLLGDEEDKGTGGCIQSNYHEILPRIRQVIDEAVGAEGRVLADMIPSFERLIGAQDEPCQMTGSDALHRFRFVFCNFCRAVATVVPLVLFLDDLQWSDRASLELLQELLQPPVTQQGTSKTSLLVVGAYRNDEPLLMVNHGDDIDSCGGNENDDCDAFHKHLQKYWLQTPSSSTLRVTEISLSNLNELSLNELIAGILGLPLSVTTSLAHVIHSTSGGNIFHAIQYLQLLYNNGILYVDPITLQPTWRDRDVAQISAATSDESIEQLVRRKIEALTIETQEALKVSACIGDDIDLTVLSLVVDRDMNEISTQLDEAVDEGLLTILPDQGRYKFVHDRFRQTAISMIGNINAMSFEIGRKLWKGLSRISLKASIYTVVNHLDKGIHSVTDQQERYAIAALNLEAGSKAASLAAFPDASKYLGMGIHLLGENPWKDKYDLTLRLYNLAADVELCNRRYDRVATLTAEVFRNAQNCKDKMPSYITQVSATGQNGSLEKAVKLGLAVLQELGEPLPSDPKIWMVVTDLIKTKIMIRGRSNQALMSLKPMVQEDKISAVHTLSFLVSYAVQFGSLHIVFIGTRLVQLTLKYGMSKASAIGFCLYATLLCRSERKQAYRFGELALSIVERFRAREVMPRVHTLFYYLLNHWRNPVRESLAPLKKASQAGMEIGDVEYANGAALFHGILALYSGVALDHVLKMFRDAMDTMRHFKHENCLEDANVRYQMVNVLMADLIMIPDDESMVASMLHSFATDEPKNKLVALIHYSCGATLSYMFGDYNLAMALVEKRLILNYELPAEYFYALDQFQHALIAIAQARENKNGSDNGSGMNRAQLTEVAKRQMEKVKLYARECPANFLNKCKLIEAELLSLRYSSRSSSCTPACSRTNRLYGEAYDQSMRQGFIHEAALSCELAGDYMYRLGEISLAATYWTKAHDLYLEWGAKAKAAHLQAHTQKHLTTSAHVATVITSVSQSASQEAVGH